MQLNPFKLERYFARYEFNSQFLLCSSDCNPYRSRTCWRLNQTPVTVPKALAGLHRVLGLTFAAPGDLSHLYLYPARPGARPQRRRRGYFLIHAGGLAAGRPRHRAFARLPIPAEVAAAWAVRSPLDCQEENDWMPDSMN